jgi:hypothetical protein
MKRLICTIANYTNLIKYNGRNRLLEPIGKPPLF